MERKHRDLLVLGAIGGDLPATSVENKPVGAIPVLDHVQPLVDLAPQRKRVQIAASGDTSKPAIYESALAVKQGFECSSFELVFITHTPPLLTELPFPSLPADRPAAPRLCGSFLRAAAALDVFSFNALSSWSVV